MAILWILLGLAILYGVFLLAVSFVSVRPPRVPLLLSPAMLGEPSEVVDIVTDDGVRLSGWWSQGEGRAVVVCFHGYLANRSELVPFGSRLRAMGASVLYVDFRCHGTSERAKCTIGVEEPRDVVAAVNFARQRQPGVPVVAFGSSMGAVSAAQACVDSPGLIDALILDGPYARLEEASKGIWEAFRFGRFSVLFRPVVWFGRLWAGFDPRQVDMVPTYRRLGGVPTLFLYGESDTVVPRGSAQECVDAAGDQTQLEWFPGGHSQGRYVDPVRYFDVIAEFVETHTGLSRAKLPELAAAASRN